MTHALTRLRNRRLGVLGLVLLVLLVLVVAHALIMGVGHDGSDACGACVVVLLAGLAVLAAGGTTQPAALVSCHPQPVRAAPTGSSRPLRPPSRRTIVLRL